MVCTVARILFPEPLPDPRERMPRPMDAAMRRHGPASSDEGARADTACRDAPHSVERRRRFDVPSPSPWTRAPPARARSFSTRPASSAPWASGSSRSTSRRPAGSSTTPRRSGPPRWRRRSRRFRGPSLRPRDIAAIGITNQRETTVLWDRKTGEPLHRAIVWQDRRTADVCAKLRADGAEDDGARAHRPRARSLLLRHQARVAARQRAGRARARRARRAGLRHDRQLARLEPHGRPAPHDRSEQRLAHAALQHPHRRLGRRAAARCSACRAACCPRCGPRARCTARRASRGLAGIPIAGIAGDQQAALFGQLCIAPGLTKNTYGTGCFMLQNTGTSAPVSRHKLLTTVAWRRGGRTEYALEGSVFIGGAVVQWLRDGLGIIRSSAEVEAARRVRPRQRRRLPRARLRRPGRAALGRLRPRHDRRPHARHDAPRHIARAALEAIAYQVGRPARGDAGRRRRAARPSCASTAAPRATTC